MELNLLKNAGKALKFVTKCTETPSLSSYLKNQSSPFLKATGKTLELVTKDSSISSYLKNHSSPVLKVTGKTLSLIVNNGTPDYLNSSDDDCWDDNELSAKQSHDMDSNGLSSSEATNNPHW